MTNKIILITDLHIKMDRLAMDIDTKANFHKVLSSIKKWKIEHLIIAGDICFQKPENEVYRYVKAQLEALKVPYSIINGNHDDPEMIVKTFDLNKDYRRNEREIYFTKQIGERSFIFLDTQKGNISKTQLEWLKKELNTQNYSLPIIVMHYPPISSGVPHMDLNYNLSNMEEVQAIFYDYGKPLTIFTGHYHVEKTILSKNISVYITPSCFVQIDQQDIHFKPDHFQIAYRVIDFDRDTLHTSVHYLHEEGHN